MNHKKSHKQNKTWRLVLVGNHGSIIPLGSIKTLLVALIACLILTFISAGVLGVLYMRQKLNFSNLSEEFKHKDEQLQTLRDERDVLMARLVITESKLNSDADANTPPKKQVSSNAEAVQKESDEKPQVEAQSKASSQEPRPEEPVQISVEISDFKIIHDLKDNMITASYSLKNTTKGDVRIAGKCVVLLKGSINKETTNFPIPKVPWENGIPSGKHGRPFAIRNFMTVNFNRSAPDQSFHFDSAIVFVFDSADKVLFKKEIPINLSYEEVIAPTQIDTPLKNSKDSDAVADIKDDTPKKTEPQNQADQPEINE